MRMTSILKCLFLQSRFTQKTSAMMGSSGLHTTAPSASKPEFKQLLSEAKNVLFLSGAGVSAESGIPTFRGAGGLWRTYQATDIATPQAFSSNPSLVWEFYSYRREVVLSKKPNAAHYTIAEFQKRMRKEGKQAWVITQNIDGFHQAAGAEDVMELHGSLFNTRCLKCGYIEENRNIPIVPALLDKGAPDPHAKAANIPVSDLPSCSICKSLVRPDVIWFGEALSPKVLKRTDEILNDTDFCIIVGTSSVVYPAAMFAPQLAMQGIPVAEFNLEATECTDKFSFHFEGKAGETLPPLLQQE